MAIVYKDYITGQTIKEEKMTTYNLALPSTDVEVPRIEYTEHQSRLELINALLGGTKAMKEAGQTFLPQEPKESSDLYQQRLERSYLFNAFGRTVSYLGGQVFAQPVKLLEDTPMELRSSTKDGYEEDIDLRGNNLDAFLEPVFEKGIAEGVTCILVDYPQTSTIGTVSVADEKKAGLRPYWVHIPSSAIIGWRTELVNGKTLFTQLRIKEVEELPDGAYGVTKVNRIRVLEPGKWTLFEERTKPDTNTLEWVQIASGTTTLKVIPIAVFMPGSKISDLTATPPLEDLAYMNLAHWQSNSDQMNILHFTRLPILFGRKLSDPDKLDKIELGPNRMIHSDHVEGMLQYVEHTGSSIGEGHKHLIDLETKMAMWGLQLLMPKTGTITATEKALSSGESDSTLKSWALLFKDFVEQCLYFTALYLQKDSGGSVEVNTQFRWMQTLDAEILLRAAQIRVLPKQLVFEELKRRAIVSDQYEYADIEEMFEEENEDLMEFTQNSFGKISKEMQPDDDSDEDKKDEILSRGQTGTTTPFGFKRGTGKKGR